MSPFNYEPRPKPDGSRRIERDMVTLENGARYSGEWNEETNKRDGKGM